MTESNSSNWKDLVRNGYDKVSHTYRADQFDFENSRYRLYLEWLTPHLEEGDRVLDLGCGNGIPVAQNLAEKFAVTGIDFSPVQIERARALVPNAEFITGDMTSTGFPPEYFSAVIAMFSIIHIPIGEQVGLVGAVGAWLKPGGYFLATVGHQAWEGTEEDWHGVKGASMYWCHADVSTYKNWIQEAGMAVIKEDFHPEGDSGFAVLLAQKVQN